MKMFRPTREFVPPQGQRANPPPRKKAAPVSAEPSPRSVQAAPVVHPAIPLGHPSAPTLAGNGDLRTCCFNHSSRAVDNPAPPGCDYLLTIERVRMVDLKKLGLCVELKFAVSDGPHIGCIARGQFPLAGKGLAVLSAAALGEVLDFLHPAAVNQLGWRSLQADVVHPWAVIQLVGKRVSADVVHGGDGLALVRNIRAR